MEDTGVDNVGKQGQESNGNIIRRTQSSLELLSNAALGVAARTDEHGEESSSADSGDTSSSARITPSLSQGSIAAGATGAVAVEQRAEAKDPPKAEEAEGENSKPKATTLQHGFVPDSPYRRTSTTDPAGLPIDHHYAAYAPPQAATSSAYLSQSHLFPFLGGGHPPVPRPPNPTVLVPSAAIGGGANVATTPFAAAGMPSGLSMATHAAFVPPRSTPARPASANEAISASMSQQQHVPPPAIARLPHYAGHQPPPPPHLHAQGGVGHPGVPTFPVGPCESFQSESTASLASESKVPLAGRAHVEQRPDVGEHVKRARTHPSTSSEPGAPTYAELEASHRLLQQQNAGLKNELEKRNQEIAVLRGEVRDLDLKVKELRQFPAGKISQIPMADMLEIMQIYGSELSDTVMPPRKVNIQKASVIRQFRRWNPNFLKHFYFKDGKWVPKLGREGELMRRQMTRKKSKGKSENAEAAESPLRPALSTAADAAASPAGLYSDASANETSDSKMSPGENRKRRFGGDNEDE